MQIGINSSPTSQASLTSLSSIAILGFVLISALGLIIGSNILNFIYPILAFVVGCILYSRNSIFYVNFVWWLWFLTPLVRRILDWKTGYTEPSPILLAPYLAVLVTLITLVNELPKMNRRGDYLFILPLSGVLYGFLIGLIQNSPVRLFIQLLEWLVPILFGFYLYTNWRKFPGYISNITKVFIWGVLLLGIYGIFQYLIAPEWDKYWLLQSGFSSAGIPEPFKIRVWGTMNSPGPFATFIMAGLLLLLREKKLLGYLAGAFGYLAFLLSLVRSAWFGWTVGLINLIFSLKSQQQMRLIITICVLMVIVIPIVNMEQFSDILGSRLQSFSDLSNDNSAIARQEIYTTLFSYALTSILGEGLATETQGVTAGDAGILEILVKLGWIGTALYMGGLILIIINLLRIQNNNNIKYSTINSIVLGVFVQIFLTSAIYDMHGVVLWSFIGLGMASRKHSLHYKKSKRANYT